MDSVILITKRYKVKTMEKKSTKLDELNTESTDEKSISKIDNEQINDVSSKEDEKLSLIHIS